MNKLAGVKDTGTKIDTEKQMIVEYLTELVSESTIQTNHYISKRYHYIQTKKQVILKFVDMHILRKQNRIKHGFSFLKKNIVVGITR